MSNSIVDTDTIKAFNDLYDKIEEIQDIGQNGIATFEFAVTYKKEDETFVSTVFQNSNDNFINLFKRFIGKNGSIFFATDLKKENYSALGGDIQTDIQKRDPEEISLPSTSGQIPTFEDWNKFLNEANFGQFSVWLSVNNKAEEQWNYSIDFFLILNKDLSKQLPPSDTDFKNLNSVADIEKWKFRHRLFSILYEFANKTGIGLIVKAKNIEIAEHVTQSNQLKNEKEQLSRDITLQIALAHYVKNSMSGLAYNQNIILEKLKTTESDNPYWITLGRIQFNIYNLINLYLQIRQNARAGLLAANTDIIIENEDAKEYPLKDLILFVYSHSLTLKNGLTILLDGVSKQTDYFLTALELNQIIDNVEAGTKLVTDTLKNNERELPNDFKDSLLDKVAQNLDKYKCTFDKEIDNHKICLTKSQFRAFYTAFNEIFENIYNSKNAMGSCHIKADNQNLIILSSNYPIAENDINIEWTNSDLREIRTNDNGNGLKIINQSLNELNWRFKHSSKTIVVSSEKDEKTKITTTKHKYYYWIKLNGHEKI